MIINDKKVCGIFHDEYEQNKEFEKLYMQNFYFDGNFVTSWRVKETGEGDFFTSTWYCCRFSWVCLCY